MIDDRLLNIIESLVSENTLDYGVFLAQSGNPPVSELAFAEAYGRVVYCRRFYPDLPVAVATGKMHRNLPQEPVAVAAPQLPSRPCGGCGGGKVR